MNEGGMRRASPKHRMPVRWRIGWTWIDTGIVITVLLTVAVSAAATLATM